MGRVEDCSTGDERSVDDRCTGEGTLEERVGEGKVGERRIDAGWIRDSQEHLFQCNQIPKESKPFEYKDIFSKESTKFSYIANLAQELLRKREEKITKNI